MTTVPTRDPIAFTDGPLGPVAVIIATKVPPAKLSLISAVPAEFYNAWSRGDPITIVVMKNDRLADLVRQAARPATQSFPVSALRGVMNGCDAHVRCIATVGETILPMFRLTMKELLELVELLV